MGRFSSIRDILFFIPPRHHIIVNVFDEIMLKPLPHHLFLYFFPISSLELFPLSYDQKSLMKLDTFDPVLLPTTPLSSLSFYHVPHLLKYRKKKWYLMPPCLTLSILRSASRVKWSNPGKGVAPSPTPCCSSYRKGSLRVTLYYGR